MREGTGFNVRHVVTVPGLRMWRVRRVEEVEEASTIRSRAEGEVENGVWKGSGPEAGHWRQGTC